MSNSRAKTERSRAKTIRQGGIDQKVRLRSRSKKEKPFVVEYRWIKPIIPGWNKVWRKMGAYRTEADAKRAMKEKARKNPGWYETRMRSERQE